MGIRRFFNYILTSILGFLGFSCTIINEGGEEYGCPYADYELMGTVQDEEGKPIADVDVTELDTIFGLPDEILATTNKHGQYNKRGEWRYHFASKYHFQFNSKDTQYAPLDTIIPTNRFHFSGGDGDWYDGRMTIKVDVVLKKKE
jgi:putative lipoprotein (rSAM/lipoprotein system)